MPPTHGKPSTYSAGCRCDLCKEGQAAWAKGRYEARKEIIQARNRESYAKYRDKRREEKFVAHHGITWADRDVMIAEQDGRCAICGNEGRLEVDHCHIEGHIRGMLCGACNRAIGMMGDDPARLRRAADYLS